MIHVQRTSEREVKTPAPHKPHLSPSCTSIFSQQLQFVSQDFGTCILSLSSQVLALCFAQRHSWILLVQCHRIAYCDGSTRRRKVAVCPYHIPTLRTSSTPWFCGYRRHTPFARYEPKYENKLDESKRFTYEKRSSHTDSSGRKCLKKNTEQFTASTSFNTFRSVFWHWKSRIRRLCKWNVPAGSNHIQQTHCMDQEGMKKTWEWSLRS